MKLHIGRACGVAKRFDKNKSSVSSDLVVLQAVEAEKSLIFDV